MKFNLDSTFVDMTGAMKRALWLTVGSLILASGIHAQASMQPALPLLQVEHLVGDQYVGFTQSCLLVYSNGTYHREVSRQRHVDGRPRGDWELPEVFEGTVNSGDLQQLKEITESADFRTITGTVGDPLTVRSHLLFGRGGLTPHSNVEILDASIAHYDAPQVFEVLDSGTRNTANSLKLFRRWFAAVTKSKQGKIDAANANSCAVLSGVPNGSSWQPGTNLIPRPFFTPAPSDPLDEQNAKPVGTVIVHIMINIDGRVGAAAVKRGINSTLDQCALEAVRKWKFLPARLAGAAIATPVDVEIRFQPKASQAGQ